MPRMRGIGDYIPASGEARALVEVKGRVGGKGAGMRRRSRRSNFSSLRKVPKGREPDYVIPLAAGEQFDASRTEQLHYQQDTQPKTSGDFGTRMWAMVLHPGLRPVGGISPPLPWVAGLEENSDTSRYRVLGMQGSVYWAPTASVNEDVGPDSCTGFIMGAWYKLERNNAIDIEADGTVVNPSFRAQFPFRSFSALDQLRMAAEEQGLGVPTVTSGTPTTDVEKVTQMDWRISNHAKPIGAFCKPWRADFQPPIWSFDDVGQPVAQLQAPLLGPGYPVQLPMPRKLVANIGRNEALALFLQIEDNGSSQSISSPVGRLMWPNFRVKLLELD